MTDFFDDLERQLVAATPQRATRVRRARMRRAATAASIMVVLIAGGAGIATAVGTGGSDPAGAPAGTAGATTATAPPVGTAPEPDAFTVSVLNATTVPGLARGVANRLQSQRFKIGNVTNAAAQDRTETRVFYRDATCVPAAREVAAALRLYDATGAVRVFHATVAQRVLAGEGADVIVSVGSDQNHAIGP